MYPQNIATGFCACLIFDEAASDQALRYLAVAHRVERCGIFGEVCGAIRGVPKMLRNGAVATSPRGILA